MITNSEQKLVDNGYQLKKSCNTKELADTIKQNYQRVGRFSQVKVRTENDVKSWKVYVK